MLSCTPFFCWADSAGLATTITIKIKQRKIFKAFFLIGILFKNIETVAESIKENARFFAPSMFEILFSILSKPVPLGSVFQKRILESIFTLKQIAL
jgi:hypothetical protein